jgi:hypothetical protein
MQERGERGVGRAVLQLARNVAPTLVKNKNAAQPA